MGDTSGPETSRLREQLWRLLFVSAAALLVVGLAFDGFSDSGSELARSIVVVGGTVIVLAALLLLLAPASLLPGDRRRTARCRWQGRSSSSGVVGPAMVACGLGHHPPRAARQPPATAASSADGTIDESQPHDHDSVTGENARRRGPGL